MRSAIADWDTEVAVQYHWNVSIDVRHKRLYKLHQKIQKCKMFPLRLPNVEQKHSKISSAFIYI